MYQPPHRRARGAPSSTPTRSTLSFPQAKSGVAAAPQSFQTQSQSSSPSQSFRSQAESQSFRTQPDSQSPSFESQAQPYQSASHTPSLERQRRQQQPQQPQQPQQQRQQRNMVQSRHDSLPGNAGPGSLHLRGVLPAQLQRYPSSPGPSPYRSHGPLSPTPRRESRQTSISSIASASARSNSLTGTGPGSRFNSPSPRRYPEMSEMELLASVSRSGGDGAEGDALKDFDTQVRFRAYIDEKIHQYHVTEDDAAVKNIVRLFRKLREGIVASHRLDRFSIEVFESSVRYAVIARDAPQLLSALSGLVPDLYLEVDAAEEDRARRGVVNRCAKNEAEMERIMKAHEERKGSGGLAEMISRLDLNGPSHEHQDPSHNHAHAHGHSHGHNLSDTGPDVHPNFIGHDDKVANSRDNRSHFASLLLIYHLVHSPREVFCTTYQSLVNPSPRSLKQRDYAWELANSTDDDDAFCPRQQNSKSKATKSTLVPPPKSLSEPFTTPDHLMFARAAARAMAPESLDPLLFGRMVSGTSAHPDVRHDHPAALERALLSWASPKVRDMASARLKKAYVSASTEWAASFLNLEGDGGVMLWAMANGASVKDRVVKLR